MTVRTDSNFFRKFCNTLSNALKPSRLLKNLSDKITQAGLYFLEANPWGMTVNTRDPQLALPVPSTSQGPDVPRKSPSFASKVLLPSQTTKNKATIPNTLACPLLRFGTTENPIQGIMIPATAAKTKDKITAIAQPHSNCCILYNNPNGATVQTYLSIDAANNMPVLHAVPAYFAQVLQSPVVMYDYRGTGMNQNRPDFSATAASVVEDGTQVLTALSQSFDHIYIVGPSLGGAVATAALANVLKADPSLKHKFHLINYDSFSSTHKVLRLFWSQTLSEYVTKKTDTLLDVRQPMQEIIQTKVPVMVISHPRDAVIPKRAQLSTFIRKSPVPPSVTLIQCPGTQHVDMSAATKQKIYEAMPNFVAQSIPTE